jgi:hypothetical protein
MEGWMNILGAVLVATLLVLGSGCAKPDWIERTLVTVDVTGTWFGLSEVTAGTGRASLYLQLKQNGPRVTGSARVLAGQQNLIEGVVSGDTFTFNQTGGNAIHGDLTVSGDKMTGEVRFGVLYPARVLELRRVQSGGDADSRPPKE